MRRLLLALPIIALLALAPSAFAGGWATVGLSSTPAGTDPGKPWNVEMTILQHGRTPLDDLSPTITIRNGDATKTFNADADRQAGRLSRRAWCSRAPASGTTRSTTASSPASRTRTRPWRSVRRRALPPPRRRRPTTVGPRWAGSRSEGSRCCWRRSACSCGTGRGASITSRRRRESHHPRRRWPRLRGGGDDHRRLRRRRLRRSTRAGCTVGAGRRPAPEGARCLDRAGVRVLPHVRARELARADRAGPRALAARQVARLRHGVDRAAEREGGPAGTASAGCRRTSRSGSARRTSIRSSSS